MPRDTEKPLHQIERPADLGQRDSRTTNYNETVRANNKRADAGQRMKTLPKGRVADKQYRAPRRSGRS